MPTSVDSHHSTNNSIQAPLLFDGAEAIAALYHKLAAHAPLPLAMTAGPAHWVCGANPAFCRLLTTDSAALLGQSLGDAVPACDTDRVWAILDQVYRTGAAALEADPQLLQGQWGYIVWPIPDEQGHPIGLVLLLRTTTADQRDDHTLRDTRAVNEQLLLASLRERDLTEQIQRQLAFTTAITTSLGEGLYALDRAGLFTLVNPAAEQMLGWAEADLLGKHVDVAVPQQSAQGVPVRWEEALLREVIHSGTSYHNVEVVITRCDGTTFPAIYSAAPMLINDQVEGVVVGLRDITEVLRLRQIQEAYAALLSHKHTLLEEQEQERTHELERTNILLQAEITERKRTEQARQQLLQQLVIAQEEERRRIARELHDQLGQSVTALMFIIKTLHHRIDGDSDLQQHVAALQALGSQLGQDVRTLAVQLRPPALDDFGLLPTITTYVAQWSAQALIVADLHSTGLENTRLPQLIETTVFRMLQEALTNIMRHAQATHVSVILHRHADALQLIVEDDGVGFDAQIERQRSYIERHFGLLGMEERVAQLAGTLTIESTPGSGTTLFVALPLTPLRKGAYDAAHFPGR